MDGLMTPDRQTFLDIDIPQDVLILPVFGLRRVGGEVAKPSALGVSDESQRQDVMFWNVLQAWTLKAIQAETSNFTEFDKLEPHVITLTKWTHKQYDPAPAVNTGGLVQGPVWRRPDDITGIDFGTTGMVQSGDQFITKKVPGSASWDISIPSEYKVTELVPTDRVAESNFTAPANRGWFLRWILPGSKAHTPLNIWRYHFGQYCITFDGSGFAGLEEIFQASDGTISKKTRLVFRYAPTGKICDIQHTLAIWPCYDAHGRRYIVLANTFDEALGGVNTLTHSDFNALPSSMTVYAVDTGVRGDDPDQSPGLITRADLLRMDWRRDLRLKVQVSSLGYYTDGTLIDLPGNLPPGDQPLQLYIYADRPEGTDVTGEIFDAGTGELFVDGTDSKPFVKFTFTSDTFSTPTLYGYQLFRGAIYDHVEPGMFTLTAVRNVTVNGYSGDTSEQTGVVDFDDVYGGYTRLRNRGHFASRLYTAFTPFGSDVSQFVSLHQGFIHRPDAAKMGRVWGDEYPSPDWYRFNLPLVGMWKRLYERVETQWTRIFALDSNAPLDPYTGTYPPWRVTDAIHALLNAAGFTDSQIDIPTIDLRLWPGKDGAPAEWQVKPEQGYADVIQRLARNYLGGYLCFDDNDKTYGDYGAWRIIYGAPIGAQPLYEFVTYSIPFVPDQILGAYGDRVAPMFADEDGAAYHIKNIPPEYNFIYVGTGLPLTSINDQIAICNWLHNPIAVHMPGYPDLRDPDHPDFGDGRMIPLVISDPTLSGIGFGGYNASQITQAAVDWTVCRLYDFLAHGQRQIRFKAPLIFVKDPQHLGYRMPMFQDTILIDGQSFIIRSCSPAYNSDYIQMASYEAIQPIANPI